MHLFHFREGINNYSRAFYKSFKIPILDSTQAVAHGTIKQKVLFTHIQACVGEAITPRVLYMPLSVITIMVHEVNYKRERDLMTK